MTFNKAKPLARARIRKKQKKEKVISQQWLRLAWDGVGSGSPLALFRVNLYLVLGHPWGVPLLNCFHSFLQYFFNKGF